MDTDPFRGKKLEFPFTCHFRVITRKQEGVKSVIEAALADLELQAPVEEGNISAGGKYQTYNVSIEVHSREQMQLIDQSLRNIQGVKMVL